MTIYRTDWIAFALGMLVGVGFTAAWWIASLVWGE